MKYIKLLILIFIHIIPIHVSAMFTACGNIGGVTCCRIFLGKCDNEDILEDLADLFPGGWTCLQWSKVPPKNPNNVHLVRGLGGIASIVADNQEYLISSDSFEKYFKKLHFQIEKNNLTAEEVQMRLDQYYKADKGIVSEARLKRISKELGIPIENTRSN